VNKDKKNIDLLFENKLKGFRESPPAHAWDRLANDLEKEKSKKRFFYIRWIAASLLIFLAFGSGYFYAKYKINKSPVLTQETLPPTLENVSKNQIIDKIGTTDLKIETERKDSFSFQQKNDIDISREIDPNKKVVEEPIKLAFTQKENNDLLITENIIQISSPEPSINDESTVIMEDTSKVEPTKSSETIALHQDNSISDELFLVEPNSKVYGMEELTTKKSTWAIGAQFAPVISYRDISINYENQAINTSKEEESEYNDAEEALLTYAGGVKIDYLFSKRWSLQSGLYYSKLGQVNNNALNFEQENDAYLLFAIRTSTGIIDVAFEKVPDNVRKINPPKDTLEAIDLNNVRIIQNFDFFEIPFMINYKIIDNKLGVNVSGGLSPAYLLSNNTVLQVNDDKYDIGNSPNLNTMIINSSLSVGINYQLSKQLSINFEPNFKYSLSPINSNSQFDYHPYYFSWFTGLSYKF
jgi:hypothetical protein